MPPIAPAVDSRFRHLILESFAVVLGFALVTVIVTWPQAPLLMTQAHGHHDALFSMWRLSWIATALSHNPLTLFDAPIFAPTKGALAFSDAVLLQGLLAWPWLAAGVPVLPVYNVLLLAGPWSSGIGAYVLARRLSGSRAAACLAGVAYGFSPYRVEHAMHLELQWSQWMPLALWSLHRTWATGRIRDGVWTGVFVLLQFLSCIYYGVFLGLFLVLLAPALLWLEPRARLTRVAIALTLGAVIIAAPLAAYAAPYRHNQTELGGRSVGEIAQWSATPASYLSTPPENLLYGSTTSGLGAGEARLFPGVVVVALSLVALWRPSRRALIYAWGLAWAVVLSLGTHTPVYGLALAIIPPLNGLRAPARFGMVVMLALSVLASLGMARVLARVRRVRPGGDAGAAAVVTVLILMASVAEYASRLGPLHPWIQRPPMYALWLRSQPAGAVVDFPTPFGHALPLHEPEWSYLGIFHHHPLVNGYSGYYPRPYMDMLGALAGFPSDESISALRRRGVRYVILHEDRYPPSEFLSLLARVDRVSCLHRVGRFPDARYPVSLYTLDDQTECSDAGRSALADQKK